MQSRILKKGHLTLRRRSILWVKDLEGISPMVKNPTLHGDLQTIGTIHSGQLLVLQYHLVGYLTHLRDHLNGQTKLGEIVHGQTGLNNYGTLTIDLHNGPNHQINFIMVQDEYQICNRTFFQLPRILNRMNKLINHHYWHNLSLIPRTHVKMPQYILLIKITWQELMLSIVETYS